FFFFLVVIVFCNVSMVSSHVVLSPLLDMSHFLLLAVTRINRYT
ncbi:hypothetical protein MGS_03640, partial [Candida albicans P78042]